MIATLCILRDWEKNYGRIKQTEIQNCLHSQEDNQMQKTALHRRIGITLSSLDIRTIQIYNKPGTRKLSHRPSVTEIEFTRTLEDET